MILTYFLIYFLVMATLVAALEIKKSAAKDREIWKLLDEKYNKGGRQ